MLPTSEQLAALSAVLEYDLKAMTKLDNQLDNLLTDLQGPTPAFATLAATAYILHNLYNALENSFVQISRTFENHVVNQTQWHKEVLEKMFLVIPKVRPAVLPETSRKMLNDLRGFRHVFRHSYDFELDPLLLLQVVTRWQGQKQELIEAINQFRQGLLESI
ncbi:MAG: hypothetical protein BWK78_00315 [Thiotrichaceae bacterium IS1]|nr:MAG: hypothetical protein BWK78_00315 [Thiotrichaceae bacterium IS1]